MKALAVAVVGGTVPHPAIMHHAIAIHEAALLGRRIADAAGPAALINAQAFAAIAIRRRRRITGRRIITGGRGTGNSRVIRRRAPSAMPFIGANRFSLPIAIIVAPGIVARVVRSVMTDTVTGAMT